MKLPLIRIVSLAAAVAASLVSHVASAQQTTTSTTTTTSAPVLVQTTNSEQASGETGPNGALLVSGLFVFGVPYVISLGVAMESNHDGDHHLYVPLAGPWLDMANRGSCPVGSSACDNETANKILLGVDGVFQAIGALEIVSAFLFPESRHVTTVAATKYTPEMTLTPAKIGGTGYGLAALARF